MFSPNELSAASRRTKMDLDVRETRSVCGWSGVSGDLLFRLLPFPGNKSFHVITLISIVNDDLIGAYLFSL